VARRILIAGLSTPWGGRLAQALEADPANEAIIGISQEDPTTELERTEFVRVGTQHALLRRILQAADIDTVVDARLELDGGAGSGRAAHERNVLGTTNLLAALSGPGSPVRKLVLRSSAHVYGAEREDPAFFTEGMARTRPPRTPVERDVVEAEAAVTAFAARHPRVTVTILRFAEPLGANLETSTVRLLALPAVPAILGFDPRWQFIAADDVVGALLHAVRASLPGAYNAAADGVLALSEVASLLGKPLAPVLPPVATGTSASVLRRLGAPLPPELLGLLRYGRGLDNRKLKAAGFTPRATSREAVLELARHLRLRAVLPRGQEPYRYEREVEAFLRYSPSVRR
jgi:UDP-glucose 4-epimerase